MLNINSSDKTKVFKIIFIQLISASIAFIAPIVINANYGNAKLADILYIYSGFVLVYSLANLGLPEQIQVWRSKGGVLLDLGGFFLTACLIIFSISAVLYFFNIDFSIILLIIFCFSYILFESLCRILNQDGNIIFGQILLSLFPILFWINAYLEIISIDSSLVLFSFILSMCALSFILFKGEFAKGKQQRESVEISFLGTSKIYITRSYAALFAEMPLIILFNASSSANVVIYGIITIIILPISMIVQSFYSVFLRKKIIGHYSLPKVSFRSIIFFIIVFLAFGSFFYEAVDEILFANFTIPIVSMYLVFAIAAYRVFTTLFILLNSWNIEKIHMIGFRLLFLPIITFTIIFGCYYFLSISESIIFLILSAVLMAFIYFFNRIYDSN